VVASPPPGTARPASPAPSAAAAPPPAAPPAAAAPPPAAAPAPAADTTGHRARARAAAGDDEERTVVLTRRVEPTVRLERVAPAGEAEVIALDRPSLVLGRGHGCDVKLRTPTASREHARIAFKDGRWTIASIEKKPFSIDGKRHSGGEVPLTGGMRIKLGDDEFVVVDAAGGSVAVRPSGGLWARVVAFFKGLMGRRS
jgi:hypothetical protein